MVRTQIQLTEEQSARLKEQARREGVSTAELIRRSVDRLLEQVSGPGAAGTGRLAALRIIGLFDSGLTDVGARHDDYLEEAYLDW